MANAEIARPSKLRDLTFVFLQVVGLAVATALGFYVGLQVILQQREAAERQAAEREAAALQATAEARSPASDTETSGTAAPTDPAAPAAEPTSEEGAAPDDASRPFPEDVERAMMHGARELTPPVIDSAPTIEAESTQGLPFDSLKSDP